MALSTSPDSPRVTRLASGALTDGLFMQAPPPTGIESDSTTRRNLVSELDTDATSDAPGK
eukprot:934502-Rhodomonas_salina.1